MPVVRKAETDMFRMAGFCDIMVNPCNTVGAAGKGLSLEFRTRHPEAFLRYKKACDEGRLHVGKIQVIKDPSVTYLVLNLPTKRHFADSSNPDDIKRGLDELRRYLQLPEHQFYTVGMPMLGCGEGKLGYEIMEPAFYDYLDDLDATIMLCMLPERMDHIPKYLAIVGPRIFGNKTDEKVASDQYLTELDYIEDGVNDALAQWGLTYNDFDAIVSGGAAGVDTVACGSSRDHPSYEESIAGRYSKYPPIIIKADWKRYGHSAGFKRNPIIADIATHMVAFRPPGIKSVGTTATITIMQKLIHSGETASRGLPLKCLKIVGDQTIANNKQTLIGI